MAPICELRRRADRWRTWGKAGASAKIESLRSRNLSSLEATQMDYPNSHHEDTSKGGIAFMARNRIIPNLLMILLVAGGAWTMYNMQKEVFPQYQLDFVE